MDRLMDPKQVADYLGVPHRTLGQWRYQGFGPKFVKVGKHVRYRSADVEHWLATQEQAPNNGAA